MSTEPIEIRPASTADWALTKRTRLRALLDAPDAFASTHAREVAEPDSFWIGRANEEGFQTFVAVRGDEGVGMATGAPYWGEAPGAALYGMWVAPEARGGDVADRLLEAVFEWARGRGHARIYLEVGDENPAAVRCYERNGFVPTGRVSRLPAPRESIREHERVRELAPRESS